MSKPNRYNPRTNTPLLDPNPNQPDPQAFLPPAMNRSHRPLERTNLLVAEAALSRTVARLIHQQLLKREPL
jgi:hypothetical protein